MKSLKAPFWVLVCIAVAAVFWFVLRPLLIEDKAKDTLILSKEVLPDAPENYKNLNLKESTLPSNRPASMNGIQLKTKAYAWNALQGFLYAIGGTTTTQGSLMEKAGVKVSFQRQDDPGVMMNDLITMIRDYKKGKTNTDGVHFFIMMGDGCHAYIQRGFDEVVGELGEDYRPEILGFVGRSDGEDSYRVPPEWLVGDISKNFRGKTVALVPREGNQNTVYKFCADNDIPYNPDNRTFNPDALNTIEASDYIESGNLVITGQKFKKEIIQIVDGKVKKSGRDTMVAAESFSSWTPVDVNVAEAKGGFIVAASTHEYKSQMPAALIGCRKFCQDNREYVQKFMDAIFDAGDQIKTFPAARKRAAEITALCFNDKNHDAAYWAKYFTIVETTDRTGLKVRLGGSQVFNLGDNLAYLGMPLPDNPTGGLDRYEIVYNMFGNYAVKAYPEMFKNGFPPYEQVMDKSFLRNISMNKNVISSPEKKEFTTADTNSVVSSKSYSIEFESGEDKISKQGMQELKKLMSSVATADNLYIMVEGHTDITGGDDDLSQLRAEAVKRALQGLDYRLFPEKRFASVKGYGRTRPKNPEKNQYDPNVMRENRRVTIKLTQ